MAIFGNPQGIRLWFYHGHSGSIFSKCFVQSTLENACQSCIEEISVAERVISFKCIQNRYNVFRYAKTALKF